MDIKFKKNYMTKTLQSVELEMLDNIDKIFKNNNIDYFLACGSALGAIRHKGFIPWDDDIDIYCFGTDFYRIKQVFSSKPFGLALQDGLSIKDYPYSFPKIVLEDSVLLEDNLSKSRYKCGVYIDLFLLMQIPNDKKEMRRIEKQRYFLYGVLRARYLKAKGLKNLILKVISFLFYNVRKVHKKLYSLYTAQCLEYSFLIDIGTFNSQAMLSKDFFAGYQFCLFENHKYRIPVKCHEYLIHYYGDYLVLPPEKDRQSNHNISYLEIHKVIIFEA